MHADDDALLADEDDVVLFLQHLDAGNLALAVVADALTAAALQAVVINAAAAALAVLGHGEHGGAGMHHANAHHVVALGQTDGAHAMAQTAHTAGVLLVEADGQTVVGGHDQLVLTGGDLGPGQAVALVHAHRQQTALADVGVGLDGSTLDDALTGNHNQITLGVFGGHAQHAGDLLAVLQRQQVHDVGAAGGAAALVDLVALQPVNSALVGDKQHEVVGGTDEQLLHKVFVLVGQTGDTAAAALLHLVGVLGLALDVALVGEGEDALLHRDQILDVHLAGHMRDLGAAVVAVFVLENGQLLFHDGIDLLIAGQDGTPLGNVALQLGQLALNLQNLQTSQLSQTEGTDGGSLQLIEAEPLHDGHTGFRLAALAGADGGDDLVHDVGGPLQTFQDVGALLGLLQIEGGATAHNLGLERHIALQHGFQGHGLGHAAVQGQQVHAHGVLQLSIAVQLVQHHLGVGVLFQLDDDPHAVAVGLIVQVADALDALFLHQVRNVLDQAGLVDHVGDLGNDDLEPAVLLLLDLGAAAQGDLAAAGGVGGADAAAAHDDAAGGEVGALDVLHQAGQVDVRIVDQGHRALDHLGQVMGRDVGGHAHGDAGGAVDQQVGEPAGQHGGLLLGLVEVQAEVHGVLLDVGEQVHGHLAHAGLGVSVGSRGVAVHTTEVTLAIHQRIAHGEVLRQADHGVVNRRVAVGMVGAQHGTHGVRALAVGVAGVIAALVHGIQDTAVHRLQAVAHIRQSTGYDNGHGIVQKGPFDLVFYVPDDEMRARGYAVFDHSFRFLSITHPDWRIPRSFR